MPLGLDRSDYHGDMCLRSLCTGCRGSIEKLPALWFNLMGGYAVFHPACALRFVGSILMDLEKLAPSWMYDRGVANSVVYVHSTSSILRSSFPKDICWGCYKKRSMCTCPPAPRINLWLEEIEEEW